jgi:hypothetical protein
MLTEQVLIKMASPDVEEPMEESVEEPGQKKSPIRKAYDAVVNGAQATVGAVGSGISGIKSLDTVAPFKTIE